MATGSPGNNSESKGFDFAADDILCSHEDYNQDTSNAIHSDQLLVPTSAKEDQKIRIARSGYNPPEGSFSQDVATVVEVTMKKHTDNVLRFLEGLGSRLSQLELYCYNVDKSVGEMWSDLERNHTEADLKLRSLDKNLQEVHRSVQILKDKQELAETQKEKASSTRNSDRSASSTPKKVETAPDMQLALALSTQPKPVEQQQVIPHQPQNVAQSPAYYAPTQLHYVQSDSHYLIPQTPAQTQPNQVYQQQWVPQTQVRPQLTPVYSQYQPSQPVNPTPESLPNSSRPMQMSYPGVSQPGVEATSYVYVGPNSTIQQQQQQQLPPQQLPQYAYMVYEGESGRPHFSLQPQHSHYPQGASLQANAGTTNILVRPSQIFHGHPHGEVIEKLVNMGYRTDHVASVIQRLEESGQPIDFNAVLDRLNGHSSGVSQGGWSG